MIPTILRANADVGDMVLAEGYMLVGNSSGVGSAVDTGSTGQIMISNGTTTAACTMSGDATIASGGALTIAANAVESSMLAEDLLRTAKVSLTNSEIKALAATPKNLVAAPGANKLVIVESLTLKLNYGGTNVFTETGADDNFTLEYADGQDIIAAMEMTGFIDQSADTWAVHYPSAIAAAATASVGVNQAVRLLNVGDEIGGNAGADNTVDVWIAYRILDLT